MIYVAFDTETTGIKRNPFHPGHLIEIAAVRFCVDSSEPLAEFRSFCAPPEPITWHGHGITDEMLHYAPTFPEVFGQFAAFVSESVLIAHNAQYDIDVLRRECYEYEIDFPPWATKCTLALARERLPGLSRHRLGDVASHFGISSKGWHRALADSHMVRQVFTHMRR